MGTRGSWPRHHFPNLTYGRNSNYRITSCKTMRYNCIAWANDDIERPWWPGYIDYYWPPGISDTEQITSFVEAFELVGYSLCADGSFEQGYEKVAIYALPNGTPTHAARQLKNGKWTSKLGDFEDIQHNLYQNVDGPIYGAACCFMRRPVIPLSLSQVILRFFRCIRVLCREAYWKSRAFITRIS
jgi:hypothetical protein